MVVYQKVIIFHFLIWPLLLFYMAYVHEHELLHRPRCATIRPCAGIIWDHFMKLQWKSMFTHLLWKNFFWLTFIYTECIFNRCSNVLCKVKNAIIRENQQTIPCEQHSETVLLTGASLYRWLPLPEETKENKKGKMREHEQQTENCKLQEREKLNVMTCGGGKVKRGEWRRPESIRMVQRHLIQLLLQALSKRKGKIKLPPVECFHSAIVQTVCWPCTKHFKLDLLHVNALIKLCSRLQWSHKWFAGTCEVNLCASSYSRLLPVKQFL